MFVARPTGFCLFENQRIGGQSTNMMTPPLCVIFWSPCIQHDPHWQSMTWLLLNSVAAAYHLVKLPWHCDNICANCIPSKTASHQKSGSLTLKTYIDASYLCKCANTWHMCSKWPLTPATRYCIIIEMGISSKSYWPNSYIHLFQDPSQLFFVLAPVLWCSFALCTRMFGSTLCQKKWKKWIQLKKTQKTLSSCQQMRTCARICVALEVEGSPTKKEASDKEEETR
jgi:hypothetical protein